MYSVRGRVTPEAGALLMRAIEAASDALYREASPSTSSSDSHQEAARRRADALALLAERALAAGFGEEPGTAAGAQSAGAGCSRDVVAPGLARPPVPLSGTRAQRYQVVLHVEAATLSEHAEPGRSELEDGTRVSAETSRRISCDASVVRVRHRKDGSILDVGRRTRTISPALRRALEIRDRGCRFPGCGRRFTDGHHVKHWADGGGTSLENCLLLCSYHHWLVHEGGWRIEWWGAGRPMFFSPRGEMTFEGRWKPPELGENPVTVLTEENRLRGVTPDGWTASARWVSESAIPEDVYCRALEAL
jgi:hypothetical protein